MGFTAPKRPTADVDTHTLVEVNVTWLKPPTKYP